MAEVSEEKCVCLKATWFEQAQSLLLSLLVSKLHDQAHVKESPGENHIT